MSYINRVILNQIFCIISIGRIKKNLAIMRHNESENCALYFPILGVFKDNSFSKSMENLTHLDLPKELV